MADENEHNPYAPPTTRGELGGMDGPIVEGPIAYESERRSVVLCILLTFVTFGFYPAIWFLRRRRFLDGLGARSQLGVVLPVVTIVADVLTLLAAFAGKEAAPISNALSLVAGGASLVASFRVASILRSDFTRSGRFLTVSSVWTFFLSIYYLQYKINQAADTPARVRRKKKAAKAEAPSDADAQSPAA